MPDEPDPVARKGNYSEADWLADAAAGPRVGTSGMGSALPPGPDPDDDFPGVPHPTTGEPGPPGTVAWSQGSKPTPLTHDGQDAGIHAAARAKANPTPNPKAE